MRYLLKVVQVIQQAESAAICKSCHHTRDSHTKSRTTGTSPTTSWLPLRAQCGEEGCKCQNYVGLVWEKVAADSVQNG